MCVCVRARARARVRVSACVRDLPVCSNISEVSFRVDAFRFSQKTLAVFRCFYFVSTLENYLFVALSQKSLSSTLQTKPRENVLLHSVVIRSD